MTSGPRVVLAAWPLCAGLLLAAACNEGATVAPPPAAAERVEAVAAKSIDGDDVAGFCDVHAAPGAGPALPLPATAQALAPASGTPRWINAWATWCKPCIEELPMIVRWKQQLGEAGRALAVDFVSVDTDPAAVARFREAHPGTPQSARLADPEASLAGWLGALGLDAGAGLPVHIFAGGDQKIRCVRSGAVTASHYEIVSALLR